MKKVYPVIFTETEEGYLVEVPDMEILTEGKNLADAMDMARDAMGVAGISMEDADEKIPEPSKMTDLDMKHCTFAGEGVSFASMVDIDLQEYRRRVDCKAVRRNVTLPNWLNREAERAHLNVSKVLQEALMVKLGVRR